MQNVNVPALTEVGIEVGVELEVGVGAGVRVTAETVLTNTCVVP